MTILKLKDDTEINIISDMGIQSLQAVFDTPEEMLEAVEKLTPENLKEVKFISDGTVTGEYNDLVYDNPMYRTEDEKIVTDMSLREKTDVEKMQDEIDRLKAEQAIQNGAIMELDEAISGGE